MLNALLKGRGLAAVLLLALAVRLVYAVGFAPRGLYGDALEYDTIAVNVAGGHGFAMTPDVPTPVRAPGYPFFLAAVYRVFGHSPYAAVLAQALLGTVNCLLAFLIAGTLAGGGAALTAALLYAVYPVGVAYCGLLLSETLFTTLFLCSLLLFLRSRRGERALPLAAAAFLLGLATLVRPTTMLFPGAFALAMLPDWKRTLRGALITALFFAAAIAPWTLRNYRRFGVFMPVATGGSICLYATGEQAAGITQDYSFDDAIKARTALTAGGWQPGGLQPEIAADRELKAEGLAMIRGHLRSYCALVLRRMPKYWFSSHSSVFGVDLPLGEYRAAGRYLPVAFRLGMIGLHLALAALALYGMFLWRASFGAWAVLPLTLVYFNMHALFDMCPRYLVPVYPYVLIFCAPALQALYAKLRAGRAAA
jgi:4-amino-4-deoxy-L-arabinose transferase-like glycosyltransferase